MEQRTALSDLLQQLLKQRDQREQELLQVLVRNSCFDLSGHRCEFLFSFSVKQLCNKLKKNGAIVEAEIAHMCLLLVIYTHHVFFLTLEWLNETSERFVFSRRRWS